MNRGDFILGFAAGLAVGVSISASHAVEHRSPPVMITITLPEKGNASAQFLCVQQGTYTATKNVEIPR